MANYDALKPYAQRLNGLSGAALSDEWEKIRKEISGECAKGNIQTDEQGSYVNMNGSIQSEPVQSESAEKPNYIERVKLVMLKHIPDDYNELRGDIENLFWLFLQVHESAYTQQGGTDIVVNGFNNNAFFRTLRDIVHPRFLGTYNNVVGIREFHKAKGVYSPDQWEKIKAAIAVQISEDIMFAVFGGTIIPAFYIDMMSAG